MVIRTLDAKQDPFHPNEDEEEILEPEIPYLSAIEALLYLAQCTRPDISFAVNLLARHSNAPTPMHWNGVKDIFRYLKGTTDLGLFYTHESLSVTAPYVPRIDSCLIGYADAGYMFNSHRARSQIGYVFILGDTAISRRSTKQMLVATSSNHAEVYQAILEVLFEEASISPKSTFVTYNVFCQFQSTTSKDYPQTYP
ncbi:hypothetical protein ACFX1Z_018287 [Malus domestica]